MPALPQKVFFPSKYLYAYDAIKVWPEYAGSVQEDGEIAAYLVDAAKYDEDMAELELLRSTTYKPPVITNATDTLEARIKHLERDVSVLTTSLITVVKKLQTNE